jgi:hypothetical protein
MNQSLKVYDCYRPTSSVDDFVTWANDITDTLTKAEFYPCMTTLSFVVWSHHCMTMTMRRIIVEDKSELFAHGYIAYNSSHSRGSTIGWWCYTIVISLAYLYRSRMSSHDAYVLIHCGNRSHHRVITITTWTNLCTWWSIIFMYGTSSYSMAW